MIPAYNEMESICRTLSTLDASCYDVLVVDDGSRDSTVEQCHKAGFHVLSLPVNLGLSGAVKVGMMYALEHGYDAILQFDADGQHKAEYILPMLSTLSHSDAHIVIGSRYMDGKRDHSMRVFGNTLICHAIRVTTGQRIADSTSGMRMYSRAAMDWFCKNPDCTPEPDTIAYAIRCGGIVKEAPVTMDERTAGKSYLSFSRSIQYMFHMIVSIYLFQWFRKKEAF
jgi:glycosyltransferase involved in cell wall biosynthesis